MNKLISTAAAFAAAAAMTCSAADAVFTYGYGTDNWNGTDRRENYDVAVRLDSRALQGLRITRISVPLPAVNVDAASVWLTSELKLENVSGKRVNVADIATVSATIGADGTLDVALPEPYTVSASETLYVGYTFETTALSEETLRPVATVAGTTDGGLYIHSSRTWRDWTDASAELNATSRLAVTVAGDIPAVAASVVDLAPVKTATGRDFTLDVRLASSGLEPFSNVTLEYIAGDYKATRTVEVDNRLSASYLRSIPVSLPVGAITKLGEYKTSVTVTAVDGKPNAAVCPSAESAVKVLSMLPVKRPLMEEYSGTWCQFCVRGIAAFERMRSLYPDRFTAVVYHNGDPMATLAVDDYPDHPEGLPGAYIDRVEECDPYYGADLESYFGIQPLWEKYAAGYSPVDMNARATIDYSTMTAKVDVDYMFVENVATSRQMICIITADNLTGTVGRWTQKNAYSGHNPAAYIPEMKQFCEAPDSIRLPFNDVAIAFDNLYGNNDAGLTTTPDRRVTKSFTFDLSNITDVNRGVRIPLEGATIKAVAAIVNKSTGTVDNSVTARAISTSVGDAGISQATVVSTSHYTLQGVAADISRAAAGVYIEVARMSDGTTRTRKIVKR